MKMKLRLAYHLSNLIRLPRIGLIIVVTVVASLFQSLGLALFIPLFKLLLSDTDDLTFPFNVFTTVFGYLGIPYEIPPLLSLIVVLNILGLTLIFAQRSLILAYALPRFVRDLSRELVESLAGSSWHHISRQATGEVTNQLINEAFDAARSLTHLAAAVATVFQVAILLSFAFVISPNLLLFALVFGVLLFIIVQPLQRKTYELAQELTETNNRLGFYIVDFLSNMKLVKATASEQRICGRLDDLREDTCDVLRRRQIVLNVTHLIVQAVPIALIAVAIGVGAMVLTIDPALMLVFFIFLARVAPLATQCQQAVQAYFMGLPSLEVIDAAIAANAAEKETPGGSKKPFTEFRHAIRLENVSYRFPGADAHALENLSLSIERGQFVAIVGPSGGGKSTLIDIICGLRTPTEGCIKIDDCPLDEIDPRSWRRRIGYVIQDVAILNDTLMNNVRFTCPEATAEDVIEAMRLAHIYDIVASMPDGLDTVLGEKGVRLSGGQKQRLALARALIGKPQILLLDEATSALDNESEKAVQDALDSVSHRFTIVAIAHRLSTVRKADMIYVMEEGRIVERGSYAELRRSQGRFARIHDLEFLPSRMSLAEAVDE